jgi:Beta-lactamase class C and other penicillin binding proteins
MIDLNIAVPEDFRGCVSVTRADEVLLEKAQGYAKLTDCVMNTPETRFATASAGKSFVAVGIMALVEQGLLTLNTELGSVVKIQLGNIDPHVTVEQLLRHTSGVPDYFDEETQDDYAALWYDFPSSRIRTSSDLLPLFADKQMQYKPGERFKYNNSGYVLLGLVIEALCGIPFDEYLRQAVFAPCGMARTGYYELDRLPEGCADSYIYDSAKGEFYTNIYSVDAKGTGAGGAFTTVRDICRFWDGLYGGSLVSSKTLEIMFTPRSGSNYGMGFWLKKHVGGTIPQMEGCDPGVSFVSCREPDGTVITVVSNFGDDVWSLKRKIVKLLEK